MTKDLSLNDFMPSSLNIGEDAIFKSGKPLSDDKYRVDKDKVVKVLKSIFDPELKNPYFYCSGDREFRWLEIFEKN